MAGKPESLECHGSHPLFYCEAGDPAGPSIIMIHGWGADHRYFDFQLEALKDYRLIIPDLEGLGSTPPPPEYSISREAEMVYTLARVLGIEDAVVLGHSMGGMIAQELSLAHPEFVRALILEGTSPDLLHFLLTRFITYFARTLCITTPGIRSFIAKRFVIDPRNREGAAGGMLEEYAWSSCSKNLVKYVKAMKKWSSLSRLTQLSLPVLIIHGEMDKLLQPIHAECLRDSIHGSELVLVPDSGHIPHLECPNAFNRSIVEFIEKVQGVKD